MIRNALSATAIVVVMLCCTGCASGSSADGTLASNGDGPADASYSQLIYRVEGSVGDGADDADIAIGPVEGVSDTELTTSAILPWSSIVDYFAESVEVSMTVDSLSSDGEISCSVSWHGQTISNQASGDHPAVTCAGTLGPATTTTPTTTPAPSAAQQQPAETACPDVTGMPDDQGGCAEYDPDAAMAENERYREQQPIDDATRARLDLYVEPVRAALEALPASPTVEAVIEAVAAAGIDRHGIQTVGGNGADIAFGASVDTGCVTGIVTAGGIVEVSTGGPILDGGCLALSGH